VVLNTVLGIDPGITTGYAIVQGPHDSPAWFTLPKVGSVRITKVGKKYVFDKFYELLDALPWDKLTHVVCEDFIMRPGFREQNWTSLETAKMIGMVMRECHTHSTPCIIQQPNLKRVGERLSGLKRKSDSDPTRHYIDAANHGVTFIHSMRGQNV